MESPRVVVRLTTSAWHDDRGVHFKRSLLYLKRKCKGHNQLEEDCISVGAEETLAIVRRLEECEDGVYLVSLSVLSRDFHTGYADDWEYSLTPYTEEEEHG